MNTKAAICREILDEVSIDIDMLGERLGLSTKVRDSMVSMLCGEGVLRRVGNHLTIKNEKRAREFAASEPLAKTAPVPATPTLGAQLAATTKPSAIALPAAFKIEKGVAIPERGRGRPAGVPRFPFPDMGIGDSFAVPVPKGTEAKEIADLVRKDASNWRRTRPEFNIAIRTDETGENVRCWRIESKKTGNAGKSESKGTKAGKSLASALL
jgi:hypothetical protein